jgi:hypothetical protein
MRVRNQVSKHGHMAFKDTVPTPRPKQGDGRDELKPCVDTLALFHDPGVLLSRKYPTPPLTCVEDLLSSSTPSLFWESCVRKPVVPLVGNRHTRAHTHTRVRASMCGDERGEEETGELTRGGRGRVVGRQDLQQWIVMQSVDIC